jgi:hypothetical protein
MKVVFDAPMGAHSGEDDFRIWRQGGDVEPCLDAFGAAFLVDASGGDAKGCPVHSPKVRD